MGERRGQGAEEGAVDPREVMPFDRAKALAEADDCERKLQILYHALGVPFMTLKLLESALIVRCEREDDVLALCGKVVEEYTPHDGETLN